MTESKQFFPSGYSGLNTADLIAGPRPQKYAEVLWTTDPLIADEFEGHRLLALSNSVRNCTKQALLNPNA
jgi:hypothetical protein